MPKRTAHTAGLDHRIPSRPSKRGKPANTAQQATSTSRLLSLPGELRDKIYTLALTDIAIPLSLRDDANKNVFAEYCALRRVNRQLAAEVKGCFVREYAKKGLEIDVRHPKKLQPLLWAAKHGSEELKGAWWRLEGWYRKGMVGGIYSRDFVRTRLVSYGASLGYGGRVTWERVDWEGIVGEES